MTSMTPNAQADMAIFKSLSTGTTPGSYLVPEIQANEIVKDRHRLNEILSMHTGRPIEQIATETERDRYFTAQEAKDFGLVDEVIMKITEEKPKK